tara:strand:+ start:1035 stop:1706 length:672 start_codon:yes stop_codon:yes gene_type:complete
MKTKFAKDGKDLLGFPGLAQGDYLAARLLLLNGLLPQGAQQAATAVEKLFKALVLVKGNRCKGHLEQNLLNNVNNKFPALYTELNEDFVKFLRKAYKLRYHDDKHSKFTLVINQYRTLMELDSLVAKVESGFKIEQGGKIQKTPYQQAIEKQENLLLSENQTLLEIPVVEYCQRRNRVYEIAIEPDATGLAAWYTTEGVNINGSFLKPVDLSSSKSTMQFTLG